MLMMRSGDDVAQEFLLSGACRSVGTVWCSSKTGIWLIKSLFAILKNSFVVSTFHPTYRGLNFQDFLRLDAVSFLEYTHNGCQASIILCGYFRPSSSQQIPDGSWIAVCSAMALAGIHLLHPSGNERGVSSPFQSLEKCDLQGESHKLFYAS